ARPAHAACTHLARTRHAVGEARARVVRARDARRRRDERADRAMPRGEPGLRGAGVDRVRPVRAARRGGRRACAGRRGHPRSKGSRLHGAREAAGAQAHSVEPRRQRVALWRRSTDRHRVPPRRRPRRYLPAGSRARDSGIRARSRVPPVPPARTVAQQPHRRQRPRTGHRAPAGQRQRVGRGPGAARGRRDRRLRARSACRHAGPRALHTRGCIHYHAWTRPPLPMTARTPFWGRNDNQEGIMAGSAPGVPVVADLGAIIKSLDRRGRLVRVRSEVDPVHQLASIAASFEGGPRAVLFEKVRGSRYPVFTGLYWSRELLADLFGRPERALPQHVSQCIRDWQQRPVAPVVVDDGPVMQVTEATVDLSRLPVPVHAERDGGPYFDAAVVIARDPETGVRNASIQRFMVVGKDRLAVNIDAGRHLEAYLDKAARLGRSLPFTLNVGVGPGLHFSAATPAEAAPIDTDELGIASEFHGQPLQLVRGTTSPVEIVAHAMFALECEI